MEYKWIVESATLWPPQPQDEPPQLENVLNRLEHEGWEIFQIITIIGEDIRRAKVIARRMK